MQKHKTISVNIDLLILVLICLSLYMLVSCSQPSTYLQVKDVSISPDPIVGQIVTLRVEVMPARDFADARIGVDLPDDIALIEGSLVWSGSLKEGHPQAHELTICVLRPGIWEIRTGTEAFLEGLGHGGSDFIHIESQVDSARIMSDEEVYTWDDDFPPSAATPTPLPAIAPSECSAQQE